MSIFKSSSTSTNFIFKLFKAITDELEIYVAGWEPINMDIDAYPQTKKSIEMVNFLRKQHEERKDKMFMVAYYYYANYDPNAIST